MLDNKNNNSWFTQVLVINLERDKERWKQAEKQVREIVGFEPVRIDAVYGAKMTPEEISDQATPMCAQFCTGAMIGCWLSHKKCWQYMVDRNIDQAMILEDDCVFSPDFNQKLDEYTKALPADWEMLLLGMLLECTQSKCDSLAMLNHVFKTLTQPTPPVEEVFYSEHLYRPKVFGGTQGYIIKKEGAKKLLELLAKVHTHVDMGISQVLHKINVYALTPSIVKQQTSADTTTQHSNFPRTANTLFDKYNEDGVGLGFAASEPGGQVFGYLINLWTVLFILFGMMCRVPKLSRLLPALMVLLFVVEFGLKPNRNTAVQIAGSIVCILVGYCVALLVQRSGTYVIQKITSKSD